MAKIAQQHPVWEMLGMWISLACPHSPPFPPEPANQSRVGVWGSAWTVSRPRLHAQGIEGVGTLE